MRWLGLLALVPSVAVAHEHEPGVEAMGAYRVCVYDEARTLAHSRERSDIVAQAASAACDRELKAFIRALPSSVPLDARFMLGEQLRRDTERRALSAITGARVAQ